MFPQGKDSLQRKDILIHYLRSLDHSHTVSLQRYFTLALINLDSTTTFNNFDTSLNNK